MRRIAPRDRPTPAATVAVDANAWAGVGRALAMVEMLAFSGGPAGTGPLTSRAAGALAATGPVISCVAGALV